MNESTITLIRHGETAGQSSIRLYGATDIPLSTVGLAQAEATATHVASQPMDTLITSPLRRARAFAEALHARHPSPPPLTVIEAFREVDFGSWEGWTMEEVRDRDPEGFARWETERDTFTYPGGSHRPSFTANIRAAALEVFEPEGMQPGHHTVAALHKGVIKVILAGLLRRETPLAIPVDLASIHVLKGRPGHWRATASNLTSHLPQALHIPDIPV
ncbi:MAG: histidine phosphatase family protein [Nannocystaceae bacterium]